MKEISKLLKCIAHTIFSLDRNTLRKRLQDEIKSLKDKVKEQEKEKSNHERSQSGDRDTNEMHEEAAKNIGKEIDENNKRITKIEKLLPKIDSFVSPEELSQFMRNDPLIGPMLRQRDDVRKKEEERLERRRKLMGLPNS